MREAVSLSVDERVETKSQFRWAVVAIIFLVSLVNGADRANIGVVIPYIKTQFKMSNTDIGAMTGLFFFTYALIQIPMGVLLGRFGVRVILTLAMVADVSGDGQEPASR